MKIINKLLLALIILVVNTYSTHASNLEFAGEFIEIGFAAEDITARVLPLPYYRFNNPDNPSYWFETSFYIGEEPQLLSILDSQRIYESDYELTQLGFTSNLLLNIRVFNENQTECDYLSAVNSFTPTESCGHYIRFEPLELSGTIITVRYEYLR